MNTIEASLGRLVLLLAFAGTPYLAARLLAPGLSLTATCAVAGTASIALNTAVPVLLHLSNIPITEEALLAVHTLLAIACLLMLLLFKRSPWPADTTDMRRLLLMVAAFAFLVIPITHLAGIDTYKWQGLATNVDVEGRIPWLVHPVSLIGFTPRAYPSAQPLVLASAQIMGCLGVDGGYYVISLLSGITAIFAAYLLGRAYFDLRVNAVWFACFYVFSPVFMRYSHWATGRGFFLALYPLFILMLLRLPRLGACAGILFTGLLLTLSHKVGLVTVAVLIPLTLLSWILPRSETRVVLIGLTLPFIALALLLSPPLVLPAPTGQLVGFLRASLTRFGWMLPLCAIALLGVRGWLLHPQRRRLLPATLATFPLAYPPDIYGAMMALPFITLVACTGVDWVRNRWPRMNRSARTALLVLTGAAALVVVEYRNLNATPGHVHQAARFLDAYDPLGPFQVHAPGRARVQVHAYVAGCPRFLVTPGANARITLRYPPPLIGPPQVVAREWIDFGRNLMELQDLNVDWYGKNPRDYYFIIDGNGEQPDRGVEIYRGKRVVILKPDRQDIP